MTSGGLSHFGQVCLQEYGAPTKADLPFSLGQQGEEQVQDQVKSPLQPLALSSQGTVNYIGPTQEFWLPCTT